MGRGGWPSGETESGHPSGYTRAGHKLGDGFLETADQNGLKMQKRPHRKPCARSAGWEMGEEITLVPVVEADRM